MTNEALNNYKKVLEKERILVNVEIRGEEKPISFGTDIDHLEEKTDESEEVGNQMAMAQELKHRLAEIDIALGKIESGGYGICEKCGGEIEKEILDIDPESRFCKKCKLAAEAAA